MISGEGTSGALEEMHLQVPKVSVLMCQWCDPVKA